MSEELRNEFEEEFDDNMEHFVIKDDQTADWALWQIKQANEEKAKWKKFYEDRYKAVEFECDRTIANMESMLQRYFESVPHKKAKTQESYSLPNGKLVFKQQAPEYQREDADVIKWLHENSADASRFIKTKESLNWTELKDHLNVVGDVVADEDGQIIPCIKVVERPDIFKVELKKEDKTNG